MAGPRRIGSLSRISQIQLEKNEQRRSTFFDSDIDTQGRLALLDRLATQNQGDAPVISKRFNRAATDQERLDFSRANPGTIAEINQDRERNRRFVKDRIFRGNFNINRDARLAQTS